MESVKQLRKDLESLVPYLYLMVGLFLLSVIIGFWMHETVQQAVQEVMKEILNELDSTHGAGVVMFIIWNNLKAAFLGIILGVVFGIFPIFATVLNGVILGSVVRMTQIEEVFSLWKILPHGIFELPAILIAFAMGTKAGLELIGPGARQRLKRNYYMAARLFTYVVTPLIILAGFIEGLLIIFFA